jgi:chromatin segregation and condensation protein Rec8/ScpA/Scc1 (kleisin family)
LRLSLHAQSIISTRVFPSDGDDSDDEDEDDDELELQAELDRIKAERELARLKKEKEEQELLERSKRDSAVKGNPLLQLDAADDSAKVSCSSHYYS